MKNYYYYFSTRSPYRKRHFITTRDGLEEKKASLKGRFLALSFKQTLKTKKTPKNSLHYFLSTLNSQLFHSPHFTSLQVLNSLSLSFFLIPLLPLHIH